MPGSVTGGSDGVVRRATFAIPVEDLSLDLPSDAPGPHQHQVFRLQVTVNDVLFVRRCQGSRRLFTESRRFTAVGRTPGSMGDETATCLPETPMTMYSVTVGFLAKLEDLDETRMANDVHRALR